jgi:hypothetical protein
MDEIICKEDGREYEYSFKVVGHFIGDKGETINKKRILDVHYMTSKESAWELLYDADFTLQELEEE